MTDLKGWGPPPDPRRLDNQGLWERFVKEKTTLENRSPNTMVKYRPVVHRFFYVMDKHISEVGPSDLADFIGFLRTEGCQESTIDWYVAVLKSFYKWAKKRGHVEKDPWDDVHRKTSEQSAPKALPWDECMERLEDVRGRVMSPRDRALTMFLLFTGARLSEALSRRFEHVEWTTGQIMLTHTKGREPRPVYVPKDVLRELIKYARWVRTMFPSGEVLFPGQKGVQLTQAAYRKAMTAYGIKWTPHQMRHTALTELLRRTRDLRKVQVIAGHKSIVTTTRYLKVWDGDLRDAANTLAGSLRTRTLPPTPPINVVGRADN